MLYRREGYPENDELVLCTVTKILGHAVFANLDEYDKGGLIHISEISPGRIRNIRDYVQVGKKVVCVVLKTDKEKGHIDLSLRRVSETDRKRKLEEIKQEQKAEKIIELAAKQVGKKVNEVYNKISNKAFEEYPYLYLFFKDLSEGKAKIEDLDLDKKLEKLLKKIIEDKFKPQKVQLDGVFSLESYEPEGVESIKKILGEEEKEEVEIIYLGGGKYKISVTADDFKSGEKDLDKIKERILSKIEEIGKGEFERKK